MARERYPGERRGLSLFLEDLLPSVEAACSRDSLIFHAIRRGLRTGDLDHLRHAKNLFNQLPRELRQVLSANIVARSRAVTAPADDAASAYPDSSSAPFVSFESDGAASDGAVPTRVTMSREPLPVRKLRVLVTPGTLPKDAASGLREIADMIERDKRLLSERFWRAKEDVPGSPADAEQIDWR